MLGTVVATSLRAALFLAVLPIALLSGLLSIAESRCCCAHIAAGFRLIERGADHAPVRDYVIYEAAKAATILLMVLNFIPRAALSAAGMR